MSEREAGANLGAVAFLGLGALNVACLLLGLAIGWFADSWSGTFPGWTLVGLAIGISVGVYASWVRIRRSLRA